ncbi:MAG: ABC transporter substrate-binding protein [Alphaproteobacteria bacterium]|nr:ABC transporter substrate-binding protein [Alphaproteobacteria bacterium]
MHFWTSRAAIVLSLLASPAAAEEARHGFAVLGALKYPAGFAHFDYVDPAAPKGGSVTLWFEGSFDSLNPFVLRGVPAAGSNPFLPGGSLLTFESLMAGADDEPDSYYGLVAESVELPADRRSITFALRPQARFHDGSAIRAEDVAFSFDTLKREGYPIYRVLLQDVLEAQVQPGNRVRFVFREGAQLRDLPGNVATLPILSKTWHSKHPFAAASLDAPLASGAYRVAKVQAGRSIEYERVRDHWARDLPVSRGRQNFDRIRYDYFRDRDIGLEALFAGKLDFREEFTARDWATKYDVPAVRQGHVKRETLPDETPSGTQAWLFNTRRAKFADRRVRQALGLVFDFEWTNRTLFYGLYKRSRSVFENSELAASGPPEPAELALLAPFRDSLPPEALERPYLPSATDGSGELRAQVRAATQLLAEAGWTIRNGKLRNRADEPFEIEFLSDLKGFERIVLPYTRNLERLGIAARFRLVETAQYQNRIKSFDFDIITQRFGGSLTPGVALRDRWAGAAADIEGSSNYAGLKNPAVDALIERLIAAGNRTDLKAAARALDRAVMWQHVMVPQWYKGSHSIAYWDIFGRPASKPKYALGFIDTWWIDRAKAAGMASHR